MFRVAYTLRAVTLSVSYPKHTHCALSHSVCTKPNTWRVMALSVYYHKHTHYALSHSVITKPNTLRAIALSLYYHKHTYCALSHSVCTTPNISWKINSYLRRNLHLSGSKGWCNIICNTFLETKVLDVFKLFIIEIKLFFNLFYLSDTFQSA